MMNKIIISILVLLLVLSGGFGYYSYTLNQQVNSLGEQLVTLQSGQAARIDTVSNELNTFRQESLESSDALQQQLGDNKAAIDLLENRMSKTESGIDNLKGEIDGALSDLDS